jgi:hypothetical protein
MPARQIADPKISHTNAHKTFEVVANRFKHAANLSIYSLQQHDAQTRGRE